MDGADVAVDAGWFPDPVGRNEQRWWNGQRWTDQVRNGGLNTVDPLQLEHPVLATQVVRRQVPRCGTCGYIGQFKKPPVIYTRDLVISIVLFVFFGAGLIWFTISVLQKKSPSCPHCGARGNFTYLY